MSMKEAGSGKINKFFRKDDLQFFSRHNNTDFPLISQTESVGLKRNLLISKRNE